ncbi:hypothetical protein LEP1GSC172_0387 [Leptospira noguchii]|uniref:Uncharacterized protein n=2 Tax=Leptospira noguchii TaxID=28182 RepID=T0FFP8_9LEPT|nr:hypothetical protein LEP1GSC172_0387 [Leptospira noguchii]EQA72073.1 hypothetical protein LEP1GSC059_4334 [Leptospira noguchii serovar Panama str. CZ214]
MQGDCFYGFPTRTHENNIMNLFSKKSECGISFKKVNKSELNAIF